MICQGCIDAGPIHGPESCKYPIESNWCYCQHKGLEIHRKKLKEEQSRKER